MNAPARVQLNMFGAIVPQLHRTYRLRSGDKVKIIACRGALMLDGKTRELVWHGKFTDGGLCAWNLDGTYRASSGDREHRLDIVAEVRA